MRWSISHGATVPSTDMVAKLSGLGSSGRHTQNCERDLHRVMAKTEQYFSAPISYVRARFYDFRTATEIWRPTPVIFPDDLASAIWSRGPAAWEKIMLGNDLSAPGQFWHHAAMADWYATHPAAAVEDKSKLIPFSLYGDEVQAYKNTEAGAVNVLGWCSDLAFGNQAMERYCLCCVYAEQIATRNTFTDILAALAPRMRRMFERDDHPWSPSGWRFTYSSTQGDLKYVMDKFGFDTYRQNQFCLRCPCVKKCSDIGYTLGNFNESAAHMQVRFSHQTFLDRTAPEDRARPASCKRGFYGAWPDHGEYQHQLAPLLRAAYAHFAAASKMLSFWLAHSAKQLASQATATELDRQVHVCLFSYARALQLMDSAGLVMPRDTAVEFHRMVLLHLRAYADMHRQSRLVAGTAVNRCLWLLIPKHHHFIHCAEDALVCQLNPRATNLLCAESFVGMVGRISRGCHRSSVGTRTLERYFAIMQFKV
ncbi:unnamed protein product [Effrenium voratum]|uniref:Uncharacterized protein n=1 Tax=Effrenium voratum TaxID=2562239 RepID=A0AA36J089_9DINO|nr:unnamed protein product [Effrenium voratum]